MKKVPLYKKIPCLFGRHKQAREPLRLAPDTTMVESDCPGFGKVPREIMGKELYFCERCFKILQIGHFPPHHPNCLCVSEYWEAIT